MTKIITMLAVGLLSISISKGQIKKGSFLIGGQIGGGKSTVTRPITPTEQKSFNASLSIGTAIKENLVLGANFGYNKNKYIYDNQTPQEQKGYTAGVFIRKYNIIGQKFYFFGDANAQYGSYKFTSNQSGFPSSTITDKGTGFSVGLTPGLSYQVHRLLLLDISLPNLFFVSQQKNVTTNSLNSDKLTNKSFSAGLGLNGTVISNLAVGFKLVL